MKILILLFCVFISCSENEMLSPTSDKEVITNTVTNFIKTEGITITNNLPVANPEIQGFIDNGMLYWIIRNEFLKINSVVTITAFRNSGMYWENVDVFRKGDGFIGVLCGYTNHDTFATVLITVIK